MAVAEPLRLPFDAIAVHRMSRAKTRIIFQNKNEDVMEFYIPHLEPGDVYTIKGGIVGILEGWLGQN